MKRTKNKPNGAGYFNISEVADILDVSPSTLRTWEKIGLVTPSRSDGKYRQYTLDDIKRLKRVKFLKATKHVNANGVLHLLADSVNRSHPTKPLTKQSSPSETIGQTLRHLRQEQGMTLEKVAEETKLSVSFLSSLERWQANASIATLQKLAKLYKTNFLSFFDTSPTRAKLVRADERKSLDTQSGVRIELLDAGQNIMETQLWYIAPGASSGGAYEHEGEEFIFMLHGRFEIWIDENEHYLLKTGDSLYFSSSLPHRWNNPGKAEAKLLWVNTPPTF